MEMNRFYWEHTAEGGVRLLRMFGTTPEVIVPEQIAGLPVTEIGAYCFAAQSRLPEQYEVAEALGGVLPDHREQLAGFHTGSSESGQTTADAGSGLRELCGSYIQSLSLPDHVRRTGNLMCYQCTSLHIITCGAELAETGSDAFMNCKQLHQIRMRCGAKERSGLRKMLAQLSSEIEVVFLGREGEKTEAKLLYPEYYESYDEIAPAHLFGRNIEGEGFRARQCFTDGVPDFRQYDRIFPQACVGESARTLCGLALNRLQYPVELGDEAGQLYQTYVREHAGLICGMAVEKQEMEQVLFLCENGLTDTAALDEGMRLAAEAGWAEGTAYFLGLKRKFFAGKTERYSFDEF